MAIHHEIVINSSVQHVYDALTNAEQFGELTGAAATMLPEPGAPFSYFGGMISGQTIEILPAERLVQAWRVGNWNAGVYSIVRFEFTKVNGTQTKLIFDHTGYPEEHETHLEQGWHERYWKPLKGYLEI